MDSLKHLTPKKLEKVANRLDNVRSSLNGLGSLFLYQARESCIDQNEMAGIGYLLQELSQETSRIEDILRCGYDSVTKAELERDYEDAPWDDDEEKGESSTEGQMPIEETIKTLMTSLEKFSEELKSRSSEEE